MLKTSDDRDDVNYSQSNEMITLEYTPPETGEVVRVRYFCHPPRRLQLPSLKNKEKMLLVIDKKIDVKEYNIISRLTRSQVGNIATLLLDCSEKNLGRVKTIWKKMIEYHPDIAAAIGGGVACDLVGFASSCYQRNLDHIFFPTTLLAMIDASIGGKTGIDFHGVKNSIGSIHYAKDSICILSFLKTLPPEELNSGFAEAVKAAMLFSTNLFSKLQRISLSNEIELRNIIAESAKFKSLLCEQSLRKRSKLLYGHNIGHGIETYSLLRRRHGDCVSIGMNLEAAMAVQLGMLQKHDWLSQQRLLLRFHLPTEFPKGMKKEVVIERMKLYKLYKERKFSFVLPKKIGGIYETNRNYFTVIEEQKFVDLLATSIEMCRQ